MANDFTVTKTPPSRDLFARERRSQVKLESGALELKEQEPFNSLPLDPWHGLDTQLKYRDLTEE